jgi:hypothetical protein
MARLRGKAMRKALGFAPAVTVGLGLAAAVEIVAGTAWKAPLADMAPVVRRAPAPPAAGQPPGRVLPILAPISVYDWRSGHKS